MADHRTGLLNQMYVVASVCVRLCRASCVWCSLRVQIPAHKLSSSHVLLRPRASGVDRDRYVARAPYSTSSRLLVHAQVAKNVAFSYVRPAVGWGMLQASRQAGEASERAAAGNVRACEVVLIIAALSRVLLLLLSRRRGRARRVLRRSP